MTAAEQYVIDVRTYAKRLANGTRTLADTAWWLEYCHPERYPVALSGRYRRDLLREYRAIAREVVA